MQYIKRISIVLICTLHFSVCTGGVFSTVVALAADFAANASPEEVLMSPGASDFFLCATATPDIGQRIDDDSPSPLECSDGDFCFQNATKTNAERISAISTVTIVELAEALSTITVPFTESTTVALARYGPLYSNAPLFAHVLVKRE